MSEFQDMVASDVTDIFLNLEEWGEIHEIGGREVICIIDTDISTSASMKLAYLAAIADIPWVYDASVKIYLKYGDIPKPKVGSRLSVDGSLHLVTRVAVETGMLVIGAEEARA